jgi:hypothetical protein
MSTLKLQRVISLLVMIVMVLTVLQPHAADARGNAAPAKASISGQAQPAVRHDTSPIQLRNVPVVLPTTTKPDRMPAANFATNKKVVNLTAKTVDPLWQAGKSNKKYFDVPMPGLDVGMDGANQGSNRTVNGYGVLPPDTNGDVSANNYIQTVNNVFTIWDLNQTLAYTGLPLVVFGPARISDLFYGFKDPITGDPSACATWDDGDPVVVYDHIADRWLITQFALPNYPSGPFSECIAVSTSGDPLGSWYRYEYQFNVMNDYPKFGVWTDGYYMTMNQFASGTGTWSGVGTVVYERAKMLTGGDARMIYINTYAGCTTGAEIFCNLGSMLPSDLDGPVPPAGEPNFIAEFDDDAWGYSPDQMAIWSFTTNWTTGVGTFANVINVPVPAFDSQVCPGYSRNCILQPGTAQGVDAIADRLMYRMQYRNFGTYQTLVTNHTVAVNDVATHAGIRWYELRKVAGVWGVYQAGTYAPDASSRWMGSAAMDGSGNIALGYSVSNPNPIIDVASPVTAAVVYPGIRYAGRLTSDPLNTLPQTEKVITSGGGYQAHSAARWGDYSSMSVNPANDCQFWYTQQYNRVTSSAEWYTRIGAFKYPEPTTPGLPGCTPHTPFKDVSDSDWYAPFIYRLHDLGVTNGCDALGTLYCPANKVTRAEMAVMLLRLEHGSTFDPGTPALTFTDTSTNWAKYWIEVLKTEGITAGCTPTTFCPDAVVTRAEMAVFLLRLEHGSAFAPGTPALTFTDTSTSFAKYYIEVLKSEGITTGCGGTNYCPNASVTRAEMAVFLIRMSERLP